MASLNDLKRSRLVTDGGVSVGSTSDLEYAFYKARSGLPANRSLADHKQAYYKNVKLQPGSTLGELEIAFFKSKGATGADGILYRNMFTSFALT